MKSTMKFLSLLFSVLILTNPAYAETPREQLKQMVEQLQKSPGDNTLREQIIKVAQGLKPAPAVPDDAERHMAYGTAAFKGAKSLADYKDAAKEFELATLAAPWWGDAYFNLGVAQDKSEQYDDALRSLRLAQLATPSSKDIKDLTYQVEYRSKKANDPVAQQQKKIGQAQQKFSGLIQKLDGAIFLGSFDNYGGIENTEIRFYKDGDNNYLRCSYRYKTVQSSNPKYPVTGQWEDGPGLYVEPTSESEFDGCTLWGKYRFSSDSKTLMLLGDDGKILNTDHRQ